MPDVICIPVCPTEAIYLNDKVPDERPHDYITWNRCRAEQGKAQRFNFNIAQKKVFLPEAAKGALPAKSTKDILTWDVSEVS